MPNYQINFSGMIAFVPHTSGSEAMALLADGRFRHRATDSEELFPHFPFIIYCMGDLASDSPRRPDLTGRGFGVSFLSLEDLTIGPRVNEPDLRFLLSPSASSDEAQETSKLAMEPAGIMLENGNGFRDSEDLRWIMPIREVGLVDAGANRDQLRIDRKLLDEKYTWDSEEKRIVARLKLKSGRLFTRDFQRGSVTGERLNTVCRFFDRPQDPTNPKDPKRKPYFSQPISTQVTYEPPETWIPLKITSSRFALPQDSQEHCNSPELVFRSPGDVGHDIAINIWNAPLADLLDILGGPDKHEWDRPQNNRSFRSFFRLCKEPPGELPELEKGPAMAAQVYAVSGPYKDVGCPTCRFDAEDY